MYFTLLLPLLLLLLLLLLLQGLELARAVSALELSITPYVIGLTADTSQETTAKCLEAGMCDVLHKVLDHFSQSIK
jgi:DNA-binding response OmpR family regulator